MPQRSPIIFWLLLAATLAVDAVVFPQVVATNTRVFWSAGIYLKVMFDALLVSQLSVVCIWAALSTRKFLRLPAFVAAVAATLIASILRDSPTRFTDACRLYFAMYGLEAVLLLVGLWFLRGTKYWCRRTGVPFGLQFSLAHLLVAMTVVAVLATAMRGKEFYGDSKWINLGFAFSVVVMAVASVFFWSQAWHWILRFAATVGTAIFLGAAFGYAANFGPPSVYVFVTHYLIQAVVLSAWLGWGPILPSSANAA